MLNSRTTIRGLETPRVLKIQGFIEESAGSLKTNNNSYTMAPNAAL